MFVPLSSCNLVGHMGVSLAFFLLVLLLLQPSRSVAGWSSPGASSIVILPSSSIAINSSLWQVLYEAPEGEALLTLSPEGFRVVGGSVDPDEAPVERSTSTWAATAAAHLDRVGIPTPEFLRRPLPLRANLSDSWEVLAKPSAATLLHCRLPLPIAFTEVQQREAEVWRLHGREMSGSLQQWWKVRAGSQGLFGDGEGGVTGVEQWYIVCPYEGVYRVNSGTLRTALLRKDKLKHEANITKCRNERNGIPSLETMKEKAEDIPQRSSSPNPRSGDRPKDSDREEAEKRRKFEKQVLMDFEKDHLHCGNSFHRMLGEEDPLFRAAFSRLGEYDPIQSVPQWNPTLRVWEMWYPSTQRCTELSSNATFSSLRYFWRTRILLRCDRDRGSPLKGRYDDIGTDARANWKITEVRQRCLLDIELSSDLVCLWDDYLDQLNINPIPCVEIR